MLLKNTENFTFDGVNIKEAMQQRGFLFIVTNTTGRGMLGHETVTASSSGVDGERLLDATLPSRDIEVEFTIKADNLLKLREAEDLLTTLLLHKTEKPLHFEDQKGTYTVIVTSFDTSLETDRIKQGSVTFYCANPFRMGDTVTLPSTEYVATVPQEITVNANYTTEARIEVKLLGGAGKVELKVNDSVIKYEPKQVISGTSTVVFDSEKLEVRVGGILKVLEVTGDFPLFKSGVNVITVNVPSLLTIKYTERNV